MDLFHFSNLAQLKQFSPHGFDLRRFWIFAGHLRTWIEVGAALSVVFWTIHQLPFAVRILGEVFHRVAAVATTPLFAFLFSNAIVAAIFAKSRCGAAAEESSLQIAKVMKTGDDSTTVSQNVTEDVKESAEKQPIPLSDVKDAEDAESETSNEEEGESEEQEQCPQDELSDAEFQRTVDEFIAKHLKSRRDESLSIVVNPNAHLIEPILGR